MVARDGLFQVWHPALALQLPDWTPCGQMGSRGFRFRRRMASRRRPEQAVACASSSTCPYVKGSPFRQYPPRLSKPLHQLHPLHPLHPLHQLHPLHPLHRVSPFDSRRRVPGSARRVPGSAASALKQPTEGARSTPVASGIATRDVRGSRPAVRIARATCHRSGRQRNEPAATQEPPLARSESR